MGARDRRQADALDRSWDALVGRAAEPVRPGEIDPTLAAVPRRLAALDRASTRVGRAPAWSKVMDQFERETARKRSTARPGWAEAILPLPGRAFRPAASRRRRSPARWWPALEFAGAMALIAALFGLAMGWDLNPPDDGPTTQATSSFGASSGTVETAATTESAETADLQPASTVASPPCEPPAGADRFPELGIVPRWDQRGAVNEAFVHVRTVVEFGDLVLVGGSGARGEGASAIQALDAKTGEERWYQFLDGFAGREHLGGVRTMSIVATPKLIFAVTDTGLAAAIEPTTGQIVWRAFVGTDGAQAGRVELGLGNQGATLFVAYGGMEAGTYLRDIGLSVVDGAVLVTTNNPGGRIAALAVESGEVVWDEEITPEVAPVSSLVAYDPTSGAFLWRVGFDEPLAAPAVVGDGAVYVASGNETVAVNVADGTVQWWSGAAGELPATSSPKGGPGFEPSTTVPFAGNTLFYAAGTLFVAGMKMVAALDPVDGTARWCAPVGAAYHLTASADLVFAGTPAGVYAFDVATGTSLGVIWAWPHDGGFGVEIIYPAAYEGSVYIWDWKDVVAFDFGAVVPPSAGAEPAPVEARAGGANAIPTVTLWTESETRQP